MKPTLTLITALLPAPLMSQTQIGSCVTFPTIFDARIQLDLTVAQGPLQTP
jgi:hypothetical protein